MDNNNNWDFSYIEKNINATRNCFIAKLLLMIFLIIGIITSAHLCSAKFSIISGLKKAFIGNESDNNSVHSALFSKKELKYNIILDRMYNMDEKFRIVQGSDWCEKNNYVYALVNVNDVRLVCVDTANYKELWHVDIPAYHANTVVFNPNDRKIYICGCADHRNGWVYINKIFVVDYDYPQRGIIETVEVPDASMVYSIALDKRIIRGTASMQSAKSLAHITVYTNIKETLLRQMDMLICCSIRRSVTKVHGREFPVFMMAWHMAFTIINNRELWLLT